MTPEERAFITRTLGEIRSASDGGSAALAKALRIFYADSLDSIGGLVEKRIDMSHKELGWMLREMAADQRRA